MERLGKKELPDDIWLPLIAERLAAGHKVQHLQFRGISMMPMLRQGKDSVELSSPPERLKKYDLPIYRRENGQYVMHRIVKVTEDHYICLGDNTVAFEPVWHKQIVGVVTAFYRGNKRVDVNSLGYKIYCRVWRLTRPWRKVLVKAKGVVRRMLQLLRKRN